MISADHPRFSCTSDMSLTIYGKIFSGPLVHTNDPSGTGVLEENILGINKGIFKLFNSLTKSVFEIKKYLAFSVGNSPIQNGRSPLPTASILLVA